MAETEFLEDLVDTVRQFRTSILDIPLERFLAASYDGWIKDLISQKNTGDTLPLDVLPEVLLALGAKSAVYSDCVAKFTADTDIGFVGLMDVVRKHYGPDVSFLGEETIHIDSRTIADIEVGRNVQFRWPPVKGSTLIYNDPIDGSKLMEKILEEYRGSTLRESFEMFGADHPVEADIVAPYTGVSIIASGKLVAGLSLNLITGQAIVASPEGVYSIDIDRPGEKYAVEFPCVDDISAVYFADKDSYQDRMHKLGLDMFEYDPELYKVAPGRTVFLNDHAVVASNSEKMVDIGPLMAIGMYHPDLAFYMMYDCDDATTFINDDGSFDMERLLGLKPREHRFSFQLMHKDNALNRWYNGTAND